MSGIKVIQRGGFDNLENFCIKMKKASTYTDLLTKYGERGVSLLESATPKDTGRTASSWSYEIEKTSKGYSLNFHNSNVNDGVNIALILQYGHGTGTGGYVQGRDYINPAIEQAFEEMLAELVQEVRDS